MRQRKREDLASAAMLQPARISDRNFQRGCGKTKPAPRKKKGRSVREIKVEKKICSRLKRLFKKISPSVWQSDSIVVSFFQQRSFDLHLGKIVAAQWSWKIRCQHASLGLSRFSHLSMWSSPKLPTHIGLFPYL